MMCDISGALAISLIELNTSLGSTRNYDGTRYISSNVFDQATNIHLPYVQIFHTFGRAIPPCSQVAPPIFTSAFVLPLSTILCSFAFPSGFDALLAAKDCSKSAMMSLMCSVPTEIRIRSSVTPLFAFSSSLSCSCVVVQGWIARVLESPTLCQGLESTKQRVRVMTVLGQI